MITKPPPRLTRGALAAKNVTMQESYKKEPTVVVPTRLKQKTRDKLKAQSFKEKLTFTALAAKIIEDYFNAE